MPFFQHQYTSFRDPATGEGGFRTKAITPGLRPELIDSVLRLISYRIPSETDDRDVTSHPVALRYGALTPSDSMIMCVRSSGLDENGRPGNLFAHSLIGPTNEMGDVHPVRFWRHPSWSSSDVLLGEGLPVLSGLDWPPSLDIDAIWPFLADGRRTEWFRQLLAVVASVGTAGGHRIIIVDGTDQVALWIGALSFALPPSFRPSLTFSTYHYDPYQSAYVVTGTRRDSMFRGSAQDFLQYFVLDSESGQVSAGSPPSPYADFVARHMNARGYEEDLLGFHAFCDRRANGSRLLDGRLDALAMLFQRLGGTGDGAAMSTDVALLREGLTDVLSAGVRSPEDAADLSLIVESIRPLLVGSRDPALLSAFCDALGLAREHDAAFGLYLGEDLEAVGLMACSWEPTPAKRLFGALVTSHGSAAVRNHVQTAAFSKALARMAGDQLSRLLTLWECFGQMLLLEPANSAFLDATFAALDASAGDDIGLVPLEVRSLVEAIAASGAGREAVLLAGALEWQRAHGGITAEWLYYESVRQLPLDQRRPLRALVTKDIPSIIEYEIDRDLRRAVVGSLRSVLGTWLQHVRTQPGVGQRVVGAGVETLWRTAAVSARPNLAREALTWKELRAVIPPSWEGTFVQAAFSNLRVGTAEPQEMAFFSEFIEHPALSVEARTLMELRMALARGRLDQKSITGLRKRVSGLTPEKYREEVGHVLPRFIGPTVGIDDYANVICAVYVPQFSPLFWELHWAAVIDVVGSAPNAGIASRLPFGLGRSDEGDATIREQASWLADFLGFWFDRALPIVSDQPYLGPEFFLGLPLAFGALQRTRQWKHIARQVEQDAGNRPWYPCVEVWLAPRARGGRSDL